MAKLIFLFFDGVGIGKADESNHFYTQKTDYLPFYGNSPKMPDGTPIKAVDACMGVEGFPMSATGQTTLYTGVNVPLTLGEHRGSYPDQPMRQLLKKHNLFYRLKQKGLKSCFLNTYPGHSELFTAEHARIGDDGRYIFSPLFKSRVRSPLSVTTCMILANFMKPFDLEDLRRRHSLYHDFTNWTLSLRGENVPILEPEEAADIIYSVSRHNDLLLYEYFLTDMYGHGFEDGQCRNLVKQLNRLVRHLISKLNPAEDTLLLTSDHGNLEDANTTLHTRNPVPLLAWGARSGVLRTPINTLADVTPAIVNFFSSQ